MSAADGNAELDPGFYGRAAARLTVERDALRAALAFYADPKHWDMYGIVHNDPPDCGCGMTHHHPDLGNVAREALK